jgi:hypothetical protein
LESRYAVGRVRPGERVRQVGRDRTAEPLVGQAPSGGEAKAFACLGEAVFAEADSSCGGRLLVDGGRRAGSDRVQAEVAAGDDLLLVVLLGQHRARGRPALGVAWAERPVVTAGR